MNLVIHEKNIEALGEAAAMLNVLQVSAVSVVSLEIFDAEDVAATLRLAIHAMNKVCEESERIAA